MPRTYYKPCSVFGCERNEQAKGFCSAHYNRWRRHGDPLGGRQTYKGEAKKFFDDFIKNPPKTDECIAWPYCRSSSGYGVLTISNQTHYVNRMALEATTAKPPEGRTYQCAHRCGKGHEGCCNPRHLYWATPKENMADKKVHGTHKEGESSPVARLKKSDVIGMRLFRRVSGKSYPEMAEIWGLSVATISQACNGHTWGHLKHPPVNKLRTNQFRYRKTPTLPPKYDRIMINKQAKNLLAFFEVWQ